MNNLDKRPIKLRIKYCGGCNPVINRKKLVDEVLNCLKVSTPVELTQKHADIALVVCGCSAACVDLDRIRNDTEYLILVAGNYINHYQVPSDQMAITICQLINDREEVKLNC
ncbi:hypothetical protein ASZ90_018446 [hydrocarbon metagenome]|uniref:Uncharacterized protein n=1 Tax=hydrocarbon metagenome TaxID=938273 RepID=A0A0W8E722_9ZZZZ